MSIFYSSRLWGVTNTFVLLCFLSFSVHSHEARPISVEIKEQSNSRYKITWRVPASVPKKQMPSLILPSQCNMLQPLISVTYKDALVENGLFECKHTLVGQKISLTFPSGNPSLSTLIRIIYLSGETQSHILKPGELYWKIPEQESWQQAALDYIQLGIMHIWTGIDHLLFVVCLLYIAKTRRRIIVTITGFTVAHSITLVLSTLKLVTLDISAVEVVIALSILFLATEIANDIRSNNKFASKSINKHSYINISWTFKYPVIVASTFGLLHGFGFSSVLQEIGLPQTELPIALFCFNLGVEIGQLIFIIILVTLFKQIVTWIKLLRSIPSVLTKQLPSFLIYIIGSAASFWLFQRLGAF